MNNHYYLNSEMGEIPTSDIRVSDLKTHKGDQSLLDQLVCDKHGFVFQYPFNLRHHFPGVVLSGKYGLQ